MSVTVSDPVRVIAELIDGDGAIPAAFLSQFFSDSSLAQASSRVRFTQRHLRMTLRCLLAALNRHVALIDRLINDQVNAILHHPAFQRLEASWRGLAFLTGREDSEDAPSIKIKVMDVSWSELGRDLDRAIDFDQSEFFRKIYESEFGSPGGEPFGVLIGDYEIHPRLQAGALYDDLEVLKSIAGVAAAAFCPFIANASPDIFGLDDFAGLQQTLDHAHHMRSCRQVAGLARVRRRPLRGACDAARAHEVAVQIRQHARGRILLRRGCRWCVDRERQTRSEQVPLGWCGICPGRGDFAGVRERRRGPPIFAACNGESTRVDWSAG